MFFVRFRHNMSAEPFFLTDLTAEWSDPVRFRMRYETRGFDEYINIYDEKNKLAYYSVEVDYSRPKRLLYDSANRRLSMIDFGTDDIDDLMIGYPIYIGSEKIGFYDDSLDMDATSDVEFAHIVGPEWSFIEHSERLNFREYVMRDENDNEIMKIKRPGRDFVCDIDNPADAVMALSVAAVEYWRYITTTRDF